MVLHNIIFIILGKSQKSTPRLSISEISSYAFESFALGISYIWHLETLDAIDKVEKNLYQIENKINKLLHASHSVRFILNTVPRIVEFYIIIRRLMFSCKQFKQNNTACMKPIIHQKCN